MAKKAKKKLPPLEDFNAQVVQKPLQGLLFNIDREMERNLKQAAKVRDLESERHLSLPLIMVRVTINSYQAICFLVTNTEEHPKRKKEFALVIPPLIGRCLTYSSHWFSCSMIFRRGQLPTNCQAIDNLERRTTSSTCGLARIRSGKNGSKTSERRGARWKGICRLH
jgi:hypothetical protein